MTAMRRLLAVLWETLPVPSSLPVNLTIQFERRRRRLSVVGFIVNDLPAASCANEVAQDSGFWSRRQSLSSLIIYTYLHPTRTGLEWTRHWCLCRVAPANRSAKGRMLTLIVTAITLGA